MICIVNSKRTCPSIFYRKIYSLMHITITGNYLLTIPYNTSSQSIIPDNNDDMALIFNEQVCCCLHGCYDCIHGD
jgi:WD40 repeat protein